jgi:hypothetical protein
VIERQTLAYLKLIHGVFNMAVFAAFLYQASLGLNIRSGRRQRRPDFAVIKRHRALGPLLVLLGISGFLAGLSIAYLDQGRIFRHPLHFLFGLAIAAGLVTTFLVSKQIRPGDSPWRNAHALVGAGLIALYLFQVMLGLGILL